MGIFWKRSKNIEFEEKRITNNSKAPLIVYDERSRESVYLQPGESKIILKAVKPKLPRTVEVELGRYEP